VLEQYPKGVKLLYKFFPLRNHQFGMKASVAAWAAGEQGKFWQMHDLIFANYSKLSDSKFDEFAKKIGLDMDRFKSDLKNPEGQKLIQEDMQNGRTAGVRGTPTIFINGKLLKNRNLAGMKKIIDAELRK